MLDALSRQLCLEEGFACWVDLDEAGQIVPDAEALEALAGLEAPVVHVPELRELRSTCARLFVKADGWTFHVAAVKRPSDPGFTPPLPLEEMVRLGEAFLDRTGTVNGEKLPVRLEVIELHAGELARDYAEQIRDYRRLGMVKPKVHVSVKAVEERTGAVVTNVPGLGTLIQGRRMRRAFRRIDESPERYREALAKSGFRAGHAGIGALAGAALGALGFMALLALGAEDGMLYGAAMVVGGLIGAGVSLSFSRIRSQALAQALAGGLGAYALEAGVWLYLGGALGFGLGINAAVVGLLAAVIGSQSNTVSPPRPQD